MVNAAWETKIMSLSLEYVTRHNMTLDETQKTGVWSSGEAVIGGTFSLPDKNLNIKSKSLVLINETRTNSH